MATVLENQTIASAPAFPSEWSLADLQHRLGDIPPERIRLCPPLGQATVEDVQRIREKEDRLCELEYGVLVEKPMGWYESMIGILIAGELREYLKTHDLGKVMGADGSVKILPDVVKIPDLSFVSWSRFPKQKLARGQIPHLVPDLVVEVLSESNTQREMQLKLERYIEVGVLLVWYVDPATRSATAYRSVSDVVRIDSTGFLDGGAVLPGFKVSLQWLFDEADRTGPVDGASNAENLNSR